jgi:ABC-type spermidine/putrescine transport system permease subunit II
MNWDVFGWIMIALTVGTLLVLYYQTDNPDQKADLEAMLLTLAIIPGIFVALFAVVGLFWISLGLGWIVDCVLGLLYYLYQFLDKYRFTRR